MGAVLAAHIAALLWVVIPPAAQPSVRRRQTANTANVLQVELLPSPPPAIAASAAPSTPAHALSRVGHVATTSPQRTRRPTALRALLPSPPATPSSTTPAYIAGGDFEHRLRTARRAPHPPRLPGGQRYLAATLRFVPLSQESVAAKVHAISDLIGLGWFDPVCKDAELELSHSRLRQIADGYTPRDLQRLMREHHCN